MSRLTTSPWYGCCPSRIVPPSSSNQTEPECRGQKKRSGNVATDIFGHPDCELPSTMRCSRATTHSRNTLPPLLDSAVALLVSDTALPPARYNVRHLCDFGTASSCCLSPASVETHAKQPMQLRLLKEKGAGNLTRAWPWEQICWLFSLSSWAIREPTAAVDLHESLFYLQHVRISAAVAKGTPPIALDGWWHEQYLGQDAAGIAVCQGGRVYQYKGLGMATHVLDESKRRGRRLLRQVEDARAQRILWAHFEPVARNKRKSAGGPDEAREAFIVASSGLWMCRLEMISRIWNTRKMSGRHLFEYDDKGRSLILVCSLNNFASRP